MKSTKKNGKKDQKKLKDLKPKKSVSGGGKTGGSNTGKGDINYDPITPGS